ncbi:hypothetical protein ASZ90_006027 [hydrocarbon metagenome]|uniref:Uncharacterized protein n=1 Tax=hydrocarbon metagenome TaxID=938273 RepID=A0A0W8FTT6_9ZZZZ
MQKPPTPSLLIKENGDKISIGDSGIRISGAKNLLTVQQ